MCAAKNEMKNIKLDRIITLFETFPETVLNCCADNKIATLEFDEDVKKPTEVGSFTSGRRPKLTESSTSATKR
ncbi:hypothetical protein [Providencia stuartii]|uniref:hypothetical protein n=1 Tax=Providencia stuartii TaxID=588 RepID=UPI0014951D12|nr:hypothetical protein [Providencia stuartii]NPD43766.1 hypothetical protein [Providencia stuartii]NPD97067.1 hypothetical protein [Providencia stuartii]